MPLYTVLHRDSKCRKKPNMCAIEIFTLLDFLHKTSPTEKWWSLCISNISALIHWNILDFLCLVNHKVIGFGNPLRSSTLTAIHTDFVQIFLQLLNYQIFFFLILLSFPNLFIIFLNFLSLTCSKLCWNSRLDTAKYCDTTSEKSLKFSFKRVSATVLYEYRRVNVIIYLTINSVSRRSNDTCIIVWNGSFVTFFFLTLSPSSPIT